MSNDDDPGTDQWGKPILSERGRPGEMGEEGDEEGRGGTGGSGGRGGRGGVGLTGDQGDTGARGPRGPSGGERGQTGLTGDTGLTGLTGDTGDRGDRGDVGDRGDTGGRGDVGQRGQIGDRGKIGDTGAVGSAGRAGLAGSTGVRGPKGEPGDMQTRSAKIALFIVVFLTAISAIYFSAIAANRLDELDSGVGDLEKARAALAEDQATFDAQIVCEHKVLADTLEALKARSQFAEQQAEASLQGDRAQRAFLTTLIDPNTPDGRGTQLTLNYIDSLDIKIKATQEQLGIRDSNPYPTIQMIEACVR